MIKRTLDGAELNPMSGRWETKTLFPKEYTAAKEALVIISATVHLTFDCSEAVSLTYHFINAESDGSKLQDTMRMTFEVQNGIVQSRKRPICHFRFRTWNTRKYEQVKPISMVATRVSAAYFSVFRNSVSVTGEVSTC